MKDKNKIKQTLLDIGLNNNEAAVFIAALKLGKTSITKLAKEAEIKRPTAYTAVRSLVKQHQLIVDNSNKKRPLYRINSPENIVSVIREKADVLESIFPELEKADNDSRPRVNIYEGYEGMKMVYQEALEHARTKEILVYGTITATRFTDSHDKLYRYWHQTIKKNQLKIREILDQTTNNIKYIRSVKKMENKKHEIRVVPMDFKFRPRKIRMIEGDNIIYGNNIALFSSYKENLHVIKISHPRINKMYKDLFEMSWEVAEEY